jgi:hypothetical protein
MYREGTEQVLFANEAATRHANIFARDLSPQLSVIQAQGVRAFGRTGWNGEQISDDIINRTGITYNGHQYNTGTWFDGERNMIPDDVVKQIAERVSREVRFTVKDIVENTQDYSGLSSEMLQVIQYIKMWGDNGVDLLNNMTDANVGKLRTNPNSAYLVNQRANNNDVTFATDLEMRPLTSAEFSERQYRTLADRRFGEYASKLDTSQDRIITDDVMRRRGIPKFDYELNMNKLLSTQLRIKSKKVRDFAFHRGVEGHQKKKVMEDALKLESSIHGEVYQLVQRRDTNNKMIHQLNREINIARNKQAAQIGEVFEETRSNWTQAAILIRNVIDEIEKGIIETASEIDASDVGRARKLMTEDRAASNNLQVVKNLSGLSEKDIQSQQRQHWKLGDSLKKLQELYEPIAGPTGELSDVTQEVAKLEKRLLDAANEAKEINQLFRNWQPRAERKSPYEYVGYGLNKWVKSDIAEEVRRIRKPAREMFFGWVPTNRILMLSQTVLSTDASQLSYQLPISFAFHPLQTTGRIIDWLSPIRKPDTGVKGLMDLDQWQFKRSGDPFSQRIPGRRLGGEVISNFRGTMKEARAEAFYDKTNPDNWNQLYTEYLEAGNEPIHLAATGEFRAGALPEIVRGSGRAVTRLTGSQRGVSVGEAGGDWLVGLNDWGFTFLDIQKLRTWDLTRKSVYKDFYDDAISEGLTYVQAEKRAKIHSDALAKEVHSWTVPRVGGEGLRRGLSDHQMARDRLIWTSVSLVRQPLVFARHAATGFAKIAFHSARSGTALAQTREISQFWKSSNLTEKEKMAVKLSFNMFASMSSTVYLTGIWEGKHKGLEGADLMSHAASKVKPWKGNLTSGTPNPDFWTVWTPATGNVRIGGPYRSLMMAMVPQPLQISKYRPLGDIPIPLGGMPRFFEGRISPALRLAYDGWRGESWDGRAIDAENGLNSWVNIGAFIMGSVSPISLAGPFEAIREEGARTPGLPGFMLRDEYQEGEMPVWGESDWGSVVKNIGREWLGASFYERSPKSDLDIQALIWAQENDVDLKADRNGVTGFYSLSDRDRGLLLKENEELYNRLKKRVYQLAEGDVGNYKIKRDLYELEDKYIADLEELEASDLMKAGRGKSEAYSRFQEIRKKYYEERSNLFDEMDMPDAEEPEEGTKEHWLWGYRKLFDESVVDGEFDHEVFGELLQSLRKRWSDDGHNEAWDYVQDQQHLIEMKYPDNVQKMSEDIRKISSSGWWDIADPTNVKPAIMQAFPSIRQYEDQVDYFLATEKIYWDDLTEGRGKYAPIYKTIERMRELIVGTGGVIGAQKQAFLMQNRDIAYLLDDYGFSAPGRSRRDAVRQLAYR